ncbi:NADP-dependent oxidoreductase domain protein [Niveomyces insectorum RCEF 264]|uniref:NADP-dependent oxidoreductase domain protein n=1 Tax=Niveomyces insectorum RCEF 264 TaxID=1081102 RepID=A0A167M4W5_9HYPO|nr:NADP-dependent oxidoreductase domain protein [Niveomyces insectorum RCEF 264]
MERKAPLLLYGTAFKDETTAELTKRALLNGFHGVDTANYPTAYNEPLTGDGLAEAFKNGIRRENVFIQTKFTPLWAHDKDKIPFDPHQSIKGQINESIRQSLKNLQTDYLDAVLLHAPFEDDEDNLVAWAVLETFVPHTIRSLGVSNFSLLQLENVYVHASVKPAIVQNRFYRETGYDTDVRNFCTEHGIAYQAFWMLKHNPEILASDLLTSVAGKLKVERELGFYILILGLGGTHVLDGTTKTERMLDDVKTIGDLFANEDLLNQLQPDIMDFRKLLFKLAKGSV